MINPLKLARRFWHIRRHHGLGQALRLTIVKLIRVCGFFKTGLGLAPKFPPPKSSNAEAYLPLLKIRPFVSVIMPVYNSAWLSAAVGSVLEQSYNNFELILVDDQSTDPQTLAALTEAAGKPQVKLIRNAHNLGVSGATNVGIAHSRGDYIAFMDHDDLLHPDTLATFVRAVNDGHDEDVFFTDEYVIDGKDFMIGQIRKYPITLDLLLSCNAVLHFVIIKRAALERLGPLNSNYDGAQDHDLMLRALERGLRFYHLPLLLYAWRVHQAATSNDIRSFNQRAPQQWPKSYLNGKKAIQAYLDRQAIRATITDDAFCWYRVKYELPEAHDEVAIIIPFKDQANYLQRLLESLKKTTYAPFVIYLVDNRSEQAETRAYLASLPISPTGGLRLLTFDEPFNFSRLHNWAVRQIPNELLVFLNNDAEIQRGDWLEAMLEHIYREKVGAVGCRLIYPNGTLQHGGMIFRTDVYHCAMNLYRDESYYTRVQREVSGVTAACLLIRKSVFQAVGGFDEVRFPIAFNDADLCLKIIKAGYKIMYTPFAELIHHHSASRAQQEESYEKWALFSQYAGPSLMIDRYYHLS
ncbi:MAG: glycosyltransferase family 2 protein [Lentisphaerae bacterium]|nr:glycosyltransferase family 2 protein [Lentisphaerota bacterium]